MKALICWGRALLLFAGAVGVGSMAARILSGDPVYYWPVWSALFIFMMWVSVQGMNKVKED